MITIDIFMIVFMWVWGQSAPIVLKVEFTFLLILCAILKLIVYITAWNEKGEDIKRVIKESGAEDI